MQNPLVTVIVITYNSSKYVLDTLESIKRQTYSNLELIISDDCSTDNTIRICKNFIAGNTDIPFIANAKIVSTTKNSGITPNYNNGLKYATGEWIKYIAGDDILPDDCIRIYVEETQKSTDKLFIAGIIPFTDQGDKQPLIPRSTYYNGNAKQQLKNYIRLGSTINGPTLFLERKTLIALGGFDEKYPMIEDVPILIKYITLGYRCHLITQATVRWRKHSASVSHTGQGMYTCLEQHYQNEIYAHLKEWGFYMEYFHDWLGMFMAKRLNHPFYGNKIVRYCMKTIDPMAWHDWYYRHIKKYKLQKPY